jgi:hypothetical protein
MHVYNNKEWCMERVLNTATSTPTCAIFLQIEMKNRDEKDIIN